MANSFSASGSRSIINELNALRERQSASNRTDELRRTLSELQERLAQFDTPFDPSTENTNSEADESWLQPDEYFTPLDETTASGRSPHSHHDEAIRLERIEKQLSELGMQLDASLAGQNFDILLRRLDDLSQRVDALNMTADLPQQMIAPLTRQLGLLAQHLGKLIDNPRQSDYAALDARLEQIGGRLAAMEKQAEEAGPAVLDKMNEHFAALTRRLDTQFTNHRADHEAIHNLESQIAMIAQHLAQPSPEIVALEPRLDTIERALASSREAVFDVAREAAESAIARLSERGSQNDSALARQLSHDISSLESLARAAEERNGKSFEAVHEALVKVVDRLTHLEQHLHRKPPVTGNPPAAAPRAVASPAPLPAEKKSRMRAEYPQLDEALGQLRPKVASEPAPVPSVASPQPDSDSVLDLNTIMRRVREERSQQEAGEKQTERKADLISAARRAAQQAAEESKQLEEALTKGIEGDKGPRSSFFHRQRKSILMGIGAVMIAIAGLQIGPAFLHSREQEVDPEVTASIPKATHEPAAPVEAQMQELPQMPEAIAPAPQITEPRAESVGKSPVPATSTSDMGEAQAGESEQPATRPEAVHLDIPQDIGPQALRDAASGGDARALFAIGTRYMEGQGVTADYAQAAQWYEQAAAQNFAPAQYRLGNFNEKGLGMPRDIGKAKDWYQLAAKQGNASAMHNLAVLYASGANGAPDNAAAVRWFTEAAELGVRDSQYNLGILAAKGLGMPVSLEESYKWFALAANSGDKDSAQKRDQIEAVLTPIQRERAEGAVTLWKAKPLNEAANSLDVPADWSENARVTEAPADMKKAVRNIQLILQKNGYDVGGADGIMGSRTRNAIAAIQKANGQNPTGEVDQKLVQLLLKMNG